MSISILHGDCREALKALPDASVQCCVTSPPYFGLRDYGVEGQIGLEQSPEAYIAELVAVFREVRRVLRDDGVLFLNLGDSYAASPGQRKETDAAGAKQRSNSGSVGAPSRSVDGLKPKDLIGIPWMAAFALRADGWWLRRDIIWAKPNPMPESVTDRPTSAHEYVFLLTKSARYYWDAEAVREDATSNRPDMATKGLRTGLAYLDQPEVASNHAKPKKTKVPGGWDTGAGAHGTIHRTGRTSAEYVDAEIAAGRNCRSVWTIATSPLPEAHFATFPPALAERCILAGSSEKGCCSACGAPWVRQVEAESRPNWKGDGTQKHDGSIYRPNIGGGVGNDVRKKTEKGWLPSCECAADVMPCTILDPFGGAGTTGMVADRLGRDAILIELNPEYIEITKRRMTKDAGMFAEVSDGRPTS